jgi:hypothetical protein
VTDGSTFGKPLPCPPGATYLPLVRMPRVPPRPRELTPEQRAARKAASERVYSAAAAIHNDLLAQGMLEFAAEARRKWLRAGGYGGALTPEQEREIRDAGFEPAPRDR